MNSGGRRVVISNVFSDDNRGGAAITAATVRAARQALPGAAITLVAVEARSDALGQSHRHTLKQFPEVELLPAPFLAAGRLGGLRAVLRSLLVLASVRFAPPSRVALTRLLEADLVVSKGGFVFIERRHLGAVLSFWLTVFPLIFAIRYGTPSVVYGATIGPFQGAVSRFLSGSVLRRVTFVMPRDPRSATAARHLRVRPERVYEMPDSVFSYPRPDTQHGQRLAARLGLANPFAVVTVRCTWDQAKRQIFLERLERTLRRVLDRRLVHRVALVVQVTGSQPGDLVETKELADRLADHRVTVVSEDFSPQEFIALYGAAEFVLASRLHSAIFALVAGTPAVAFSIDGTKTDGVFEMLGVPEWVLPYPDFDVGVLLETLEWIAADGGRARRTTQARVAGARERIENAHEALKAAVEQASLTLH